MQIGVQRRKVNRTPRGEYYTELLTQVYTRDRKSIIREIDFHKKNHPLSMRLKIITKVHLLHVDTYLTEIVRAAGVDRDMTSLCGAGAGPAAVKISWLQSEGLLLSRKIVFMVDPGHFFFVFELSDCSILQYCSRGHGIHTAVQWGDSGSIRLGRIFVDMRLQFWDSNQSLTNDWLPMSS